MLAVRMGGVLIKLGQFLSARTDILPIYITGELAGLQDEVPPAPSSYSLSTLVGELGLPPDELFVEIDATPVAAASLGQVYYAVLRDGRSVAIKVQRPRIDEIVDIDLRALSWAVRIIKNYPQIKRRADLEALFQEFQRVLYQELDYTQEARNAELIRSNFADTPGVYIPKPYPELTTRRVLVMERINGIKISDIAALDRAGVDRLELAERFFKAYLKQFFFDGIFHADPHPGNLFVRVDSSVASDESRQPVSYTLIFVDFGMVGQLTPRSATALREGTIATATNDPERFVASLDQAGMILPSADRRQIIKAVQILFRHTYDRSMRELSNLDVESIFGEVQHLVHDLPFQMPQDLIYLGRAVGMMSGLAVTLAPDINLFDTMKPFVQQMIAREQREGDWSERLHRELVDLTQLVAGLPRRMDAYYQMANRGDLQVNVDLRRLERSMRRLERATIRLAGSIIAASLLIGGVVLRVDGFASEAFWAWAVAALIGLWTFWPRGEGRS